MSLVSFLIRLIDSELMVETLKFARNMGHISPLKELIGRYDFAFSLCSEIALHDVVSEGTQSWSGSED